MKNKLVLKFLAAALVVSMCVPQTAGMALAAAPAAVQTEIAEGAGSGKPEGRGVFGTDRPAECF